MGCRCSGSITRSGAGRSGAAGGGGVVDPVSAGFQVAGQGAGSGGSGLCGGEV